MNASKHLVVYSTEPHNTIIGPRMSVVPILKNSGLNHQECDGETRVEGRAQDDGCAAALENNQSRKELLDYLTMWENVLKMIFRFLRRFWEELMLELQKSKLKKKW